VANALLEHCKAQGGDHDLDFDAILDGLCWLALERGTNRPGCRLAWNSWADRNGELSNPGLNLLSAAAYFRCVSMVRDLLGQGYDPVKDNDLFPSPMYLAAWTGQAEILELMQEHLPEFEEIDPGNKWAGYRSKIGPGSLVGAAARGDMNMMRLALYPPSRIIPPRGDDGEGEKEGTVPNSILVLGQKPGSIPRGPAPYGCISGARYTTQTPEITKTDVYTLRHAIRMEHTEMVELLLRMGAGSERARSRFLDQARDAGLESMVDLFEVVGGARDR
jgi:ankyrin repeat protein